jgi:putative tricarboxylic transport membrane protein
MTLSMKWMGGATALALLTIALPAGAQAWRPDKAVELVTSSAQGGSNDKVARQLQKIMQDEKLLPTPVSVVNKPGGNQTLARVYLNQHPGDAHYFDIGNPTLISNHISGITPISHRDITPVALLISEYTVFTVKADSPLKTFADLVALLKKDPEAVSIGISNRGGTNHLTMAMAAKAAGVDPRKLKMVVFKSNSESVTAVLGGHLQLVAASVPSVAGQLQAGNLRAIAVGSPQRQTGALASIPTLKEQGINVSLDNWRAIIGPRGLSAPQVAYWEDVLGRIVVTPEWKKDLEANNWSASFMKSREFAKFMDAEYADTKTILTELGLVK